MLKNPLAGTDYFADQGSTARLVAAWALAPFALMFTIGALMMPVGAVCIAYTGDLQLAAIVLASGLVHVLFAISLSWLAFRLFRGRKSANGVTILPTWLIWIFLLTFLAPLSIGMLSAAFQAVMAGNMSLGLSLVVACGFMASLIRALPVAFRLSNNANRTGTEKSNATDVGA
jgi:hypothetical protein